MVIRCLDERRGTQGLNFERKPKARPRMGTKQSHAVEFTESVEVSLVSLVMWRDWIGGVHFICDEVGKDVTGSGACRGGEVMACWKIIGLTGELLFY